MLLRQLFWIRTIKKFQHWKRNYLTFKIFEMPAKKYIPKFEHRLLTVKLSYNGKVNRFYVQLWDVNPSTLEANYLLSINVNENEALSISRETGIKIIG